MIGLGWGLLAAMIWGTQDLIAGYLGRRASAITVTVVGSLIGLFVAALGVAILRPAFPGPVVIAQLLMLGVPIGASYFGIYYALQQGPVAVVSPMMASYSVVALVLGMAFLGERPAGFQTLMVPVSAVGAAMCAFVYDERTARPRLAGRGPAVAFVVVGVSAIVTVSMKDPLRQANWISAVFLLRSSGVAAIAVIALGLRAREPRWAAGRSNTNSATSRSRRDMALMAAIGLLDVIGIAAFSLGLQAGDAWVVALGTSASPALVVIGATLLLRERLQRTQWVGLGLLATSLAVIARA